MKNYLYIIGQHLNILTWVTRHDATRMKTVLCRGHTLLKPVFMLPFPTVAL